MESASWSFIFKKICSKEIMQKFKNPLKMYYKIGSLLMTVLIVTFMKCHDVFKNYRVLLLSVPEWDINWKRE